MKRFFLNTAFFFFCTIFTYSQVPESSIRFIVLDKKGKLLHFNNTARNDCPYGNTNEVLDASCVNLLVAKERHGVQGSYLTKKCNDPRVSYNTGVGGDYDLFIIHYEKNKQDTMLIQFNNVGTNTSYYIEIKYKSGIYIFDMNKNSPYNLTPKRWRQRAIRRKLLKTL
jgi:hypothetical protein